jgi:hypothetical protein
MNGYCRLKTWLALFVAVCAVIGPTHSFLIPSPSGDTSEIYPFFSWFLFYKVPPKRDQYEISVHQLAGHEFTPARDYQSLRETLPYAGSAVSYAVIQRMGKALKSGDEQAFEQLRAFFEEVMLPPPCTYDLTVISAAPLERYRNPGLPRKILRTFTTKGLSP